MTHNYSDLTELKYLTKTKAPVFLTDLKKNSASLEFRSGHVRVP